MMNDGRSSVGKWSKTKTGKNKRQDQGRSCWSISSRSRSNSSNINGRATQSTPLGRKWVAGGWLVGGSWVVVALRLTTMKAKHCPGLRGPLIQATPASPPLLLSWCVCVRACPNFFTFFRLSVYSIFSTFCVPLILLSSLSLVRWLIFYGPVACYSFLTAWSLVSRSYSLGAPSAGHWGAILQRSLVTALVK